LALALHGAVIYWVSQKPVPVLPIVSSEVPPMSLGFSLPAPGSSANAAYLKTPALLK
jgi:protein TonB